MAAQNFDTWLEAELRESLGGLMTAATPAVGFRPRTRMRRRILLPFAPGLAVGAAAKAGIVFAAAAAVIAGTATAISGSPNPAVWGQRVEVQVAHCKQLRDRQPQGIGHCVSDLASKPDRPRGGMQKPTQAQPPTSTDRSQPTPKPTPQPSPTQDQAQSDSGPGQTCGGDDGSSKHAKDPDSKHSDPPPHSCHD